MKNLETLTLVNSNERVDDLGCKGYRVIQNPEVFCFGVDAVLLAHYAKVTRPNQKILDIGTGTGIIPILMHGTYERGCYTGIDIQEEMIEMAMRTVKLNQIEKDVRMMCVDIKSYKEHFSSDQFDIITCNPPYMKGVCGLKNEHLSKTIARHEVACTLEDIVKASSYMLKDRGKLYMIHRPHRLVDIMNLMRENKVEPKAMRMIYPKRDKEPTMVLIQGVRNGKPELRVEKPLIMYKKDGSYTEEIHQIYNMK